MEAPHPSDATSCSGNNQPPLSMRLIAQAIGKGLPSTQTQGKRDTAFVYENQGLCEEGGNLLKSEFCNEVLENSNE